MNRSIVVLQNASKQIHKKLILKDINLTFNIGLTTAIVGHNGSGKSTLLKLIAGIYEPTKGTIERMTKRISYVPEHFPENLRFKVKEYLYIMGKMRGLDSAVLQKNIHKYSGQFGIEAYLDTPLNNCSKGTKQKVGIILALLLKSDILLLDEPLSGLDAESQNELAMQLKSIKSDHCIVFTAHESLLVDRLADQVIQINKGKAESHLYSLTQGKQMVINIKVYDRSILHTLTGILEMKFEGQDTAVLIVSNHDSDRVLLQLLEQGCSILKLDERR
ncbi:ABC transporter ATP-binding protein [Niallia oryzisoli]|uniref:ABC transporter ATP-binding protein n=1 Tax=Niallia oryzisoli TaxID=1737571 RepID=A0ABZ2CDN4_9BACI